MELEEAIRQRAYFIWIDEGCEEGNADAHWLAAEHEILIASMEAAATVMATCSGDKPCSKSKVKKSVGKTERKVAPNASTSIGAPARRPRRSLDLRAGTTRH